MMADVAGTKREERWRVWRALRVRAKIAEKPLIDTKKHLTTKKGFI